MADEEDTTSTPDNVWKDEITNCWWGRWGTYCRILSDEEEVSYCPKTPGTVAKAENVVGQDVTLCPQLGDWPGAQAQTDIPETLKTAIAVVNGPRRAAYGHPLDNFTRIAKGIEMILDVPCTAEQACLIMDSALKTSRLICTPDHQDSITDKFGYMLCYDEILKERKRRAVTAGERAADGFNKGAAEAKQD